ncbi:MAG: DNA (cytosine-5-)-methyltransferase [Gammaproteobacteria bacterium AqS3]|nr:DNA (cytosine-5-)-methyltransferase [Gammaproteobacteria bacterium AqS3]
MSRQHRKPKQLTLYGKFDCLSPLRVKPPLVAPPAAPQTTTPHPPKQLKTFIDLFAGVGGFHLAASRQGLECVFASEIDQAAGEVYAANFGLAPAGDITAINARDIPDHDLLCAGFPCQPFSIIGSRGGFEDTRGTLFFDIARILAEKRPTAFILENVRQLVTAGGGVIMRRILETLEELGYQVEYRILNALDYGLPQKRERVLIVGRLDTMDGFDWPEPVKRRKTLKQLLEKNPDKRHFVSERIARARRDAHQTDISPTIWHENKGGNIASHSFSCALRAGASYNYLLVDGKRRLTPREMFRLQGFPDTFKLHEKDSQCRKQAGNSVPVPMIEAAIRSLAHAGTTQAEGRQRQAVRAVANRPDSAGGHPCDRQAACASPRHRA